jgi:hypothetical protein
MVAGLGCGVNAKTIVVVYVHNRCVSCVRRDERMTCLALMALCGPRYQLVHVLLVPTLA